jgi:myo-inositol-1(or 4)-monophosphatase
MSPPLRREALADVADAAASLARRGATSPLQVSLKDDLSPVTAVDRAVDAFLKRELGRLLPGSGWLSEETVDDRERLTRVCVWIVDPIDGTRQLVRGIPEVAISIGLASSGQVVAAAVVNPMTGERGTWVEGGPPVFEGLEARRPPERLEVAEAIVSRTESEAGDLAGLQDLVGATRPVGSVAYKLLRVAAGADALTYSVRPKFEWDVCGGAGLVIAAGGVYLRLDGAPLRFNGADVRIASGAVAGPASLAEALRSRLIARAAGA